MFLMVQIAISTLFHIEFLVMKKILLVILSFKNVGILVLLNFKVSVLTQFGSYIKTFYTKMIV